MDEVVEYVAVEAAPVLHRAVLTLLCLDQSGSEILCMAPNIEQLQVVDHVSNEAMGEKKRNILVESARIARGNIHDIASIHADTIDSLVFPGGFGAAKNLCSFADDGPDCRVNPETERLICEMLDTNKPIGALCIAPVLIAKVAGKKGLNVKVTIGRDPDTSRAIEAMGAVHEECPVNRAVIDSTHRIVTSPAYMLAQSIKEVSESVHALVQGILQLLKT